MINLDVGFLSEDGLAVALSTDLIETPQIKFPILKYVKVRPVVGWSMNRLFSGSYKDEGGFQIADSENLFIGLNLVDIKF
jgi:hypothetical protein